MNIAMPSLMIKTMRQKFDHQRSTRKADPSPEEQGRVLDLVRGARVEADARLCEQKIQAKDLVSLKPGDVLTFDLAVDAPLDLILNGSRLFKGHVVSVGAKRGFAVAGENTM
jgi:flagellar motor switch protein FliM